MNVFFFNGGRGFEKVVLYETKFTVKDITLGVPRGMFKFLYITDYLTYIYFTICRFLCGIQFVFNQYRPQKSAALQVQTI